MQGHSNFGNLVFERCLKCVFADKLSCSYLPIENPKRFEGIEVFRVSTYFWFDGKELAHVFYKEKAVEYSSPKSLFEFDYNGTTYYHFDFAGGDGPHGDEDRSELLFKYKDKYYTSSIPNTCPSSYYGGP